MFDFFRKRSKEKPYLSGWDINPGPAFREIRNLDSTQYVNADESIVLYFSVLIVTGNGPLSGAVVGQPPKVTKEGNGWQLKAAKPAAGHVLVCVISCSDEDKLEWAKSFFDSLAYTNSG